jgi:pimeloyl-ACP methyl ester carboxylesterase
MLEATKTITPELVAQFDKWAPSFENPFAFKNGAMGWALDEHSMMVPWGFEPASITKPVFLFSGEADPNVNPICSKWLAGKIAGATLTLLPNRDHDQIASAEVVEQALSALDAAL